METLSCLNLGCDGYLKILEARSLDIEYSLFFEDLFDDLKERCLRGLKLIVPDERKVINKEIRKSFLDKLSDMSRQLIRQVLKTVPKKKQNEVIEKLK